MNPKLSVTSTNNALGPPNHPSSLPLASQSSQPSSQPPPPIRRPSAYTTADFNAEQRHFYVSTKLLFRWLLMLWLSGGIVIYLINATRSTRTAARSILGLPGKAVYVLAISNHLSLIGAVFFDLGPLLILSTALQCALLIALPALIVDVIPNLLTYGVLLLSIIMLLCYGVLYMRSSDATSTANASAVGSPRGSKPFDPENSGEMVGSRRPSTVASGKPWSPTRTSLSPDISSPGTNSNKSPSTSNPTPTTLSIPRNSCQF